MVKPSVAATGDAVRQSDDLDAPTMVFEDSLAHQNTEEKMQEPTDTLSLISELRLQRERAGRVVAAAKLLYDAKRAAAIRKERLAAASLLLVLAVLTLVSRLMLPQFEHWEAWRTAVFSTLEVASTAAVILFITRLSVSAPHKRLHYSFSLT